MLKKLNNSLKKKWINKKKIVLTLFRQSIEFGLKSSWKVVDFSVRCRLESASIKKLWNDKLTEIGLKSSWKIVDFYPYPVVLKVLKKLNNSLKKKWINKKKIVLTLFRQSIEFGLKSSWKVVDFSVRCRLESASIKKLWNDKLTEIGLKSSWKIVDFYP